jgi:hypothetical protein
MGRGRLFERRHAIDGRAKPAHASG